MTGRSDVEATRSPRSEATLIAAVRGGGPGRGAALAELAQRGSARAAAALAAVLRDPGAEARLRAAAAVALGRRAAPGSTRALVDALGSGEPPVVRRAAEALGRVGGREALAALRAVPPQRDPATSRALAFARSLLSYRLGLGVELLAVPAGASAGAAGGGRSTRLRPSPLGGAVARATAQSLPEELPALPVRLEGGVLLDGAGECLALVPHADAAESIRSNFVAAVVLRRTTVRQRLDVHLYLLSHPLAGGRLALFGVLTDGTLTHAGEGRLGDGEVQFRLGPLDTPYRPRLEIKGRLLLAGPRIEVSQASVRRSPAQPGARTPERVVAPAAG